MRWPLPGKTCLSQFVVYDIDLQLQEVGKLRGARKEGIVIPPTAAGRLVAGRIASGPS
jgi:hypothetical protein